MEWNAGFFFKANNWIKIDLESLALVKVNAFLVK